MKPSNILLLLICLASLCFTDAHAQKRHQKKQAQIQREQQAIQSIESKEFVFRAEEAIPMGHGNIHLTYGYYLKVSPDSIQAYLPYYGRAYRAPNNPNEAGIQFCSTHFEYEMSTTRNNGYQIKIVPKDLKDKSYVLRLFLYPAGNSSLTVTDSDRQTISFDGSLE